MEQIQFIYFQDYMQYYTVHHKENSTYMEIWHRGWWFKLRPQLPVCFGFTIRNLIATYNHTVTVTYNRTVTVTYNHTVTVTYNRTVTVTYNHTVTVTAL